MSARTILITGCSSGIGRASARVMKARGWRVIATARTDDDLAALRRDAGVEALRLELSRTESIADCVDKTLTLTGGRLDTLFNNAAYGQMGAVEDLTTDLLRQQFEVNLFGQHELTRRILPVMRRQGHGRIVQCSSVLGLVSAPLRGAYCASKFALEALSDSLRMELEGSGVHVSLIEPGPIRTRFVEHALANFLRTIDIAGSPNRVVYEARLARMQQGGNNFFKLEPEAVARKLVHAAESKRPRARYYVTAPTYFAAAMRRVAPRAAMDWFVRRM
ncbi:MAG: SDR family NAD(P)-dependent oxidoreductase [Hyphomicrobium sp.]|nr:SDR family NAD(P)-dependent oxidoreductase [Hyphomicrobium sp.]